MTDARNGIFFWKDGQNIEKWSGLYEGVGQGGFAVAKIIDSDDQKVEPFWVKLRNNKGHETLLGIIHSCFNSGDAAGSTIKPY